MDTKDSQQYPHMAYQAFYFHRSLGNTEPLFSVPLVPKLAFYAHPSLTVSYLLHHIRSECFLGILESSSWELGTTLSAKHTSFSAAERI